MGYRYRCEEMLLKRQFQVAMVVGRFSKAIEIQRKQVEEILDFVGKVNVTTLHKAGARSVAGRFGIHPSMAWLVFPIAIYDQAAQAMAIFENSASEAETMDLQLGMLYLEQGDVRSAINRFQHVVQLRPKVPAPARSSAESYLKLFRQP
jgi:hypothetical protein